MDTPKKVYSPALLRRIELYKQGKWREALAELPGWEDTVLDALKPTLQWRGESNKGG